MKWLPIHLPHFIVLKLMHTYNVDIILISTCERSRYELLKI